MCVYIYEKQSAQHFQPTSLKKKKATFQEALRNPTNVVHAVLASFIFLDLAAQRAANADGSRWLRCRSRSEWRSVVVVVAATAAVAEGERDWTVNAELHVAAALVVMTGAVSPRLARAIRANARRLGRHSAAPRLRRKRRQNQGSAVGRRASRTPFHHCSSSSSMRVVLRRVPCHYMRRGGWGRCVRRRTASIRPDVPLGNRVAAKKGVRVVDTVIARLNRWLAFRLMKATSLLFREGLCVV